MMEIHLMKATSAPWLLEFPDFKADDGMAEGLGYSLFPEGKNGISRHIKKKKPEFYTACVYVIDKWLPPPSRMQPLLRRHEGEQGAFFTDTSLKIVQVTFRDETPKVKYGRCGKFTFYIKTLSSVCLCLQKQDHFKSITLCFSALGIELRTSGTSTMQPTPTEKVKPNRKINPHMYKRSWCEPIHHQQTKGGI